MYTELDNELLELSEKLERKQKVDSMLSSLYARQKSVREKERGLKNIMHREQGDVQALEKTSLTNILYSLTGKKEEKLERERAEAMAAKLTYEAAKRELEDIELKIKTLLQEQFELKKAQTRYNEVLRLKKEALIQSGLKEGEEILKLEHDLGRLRAQQREIGEASSAAGMAMSLISSIEDRLSRAKDWAKWDMVTDGSLLAHVKKHEHLDDAQELANSLQTQLGRLRTELSDIDMHLLADINIQGFERFADWFFDGLFADWAVLKRINQSQESVSSVRHSVQSIQNRLRGMDSEVKSAIARAGAHLDELIINAH